MRIALLVFCLGLGSGCASSVKLTDWKVDAGGAKAGESSSLPPVYLGVPTEYRGWDVARLTVDPATPLNVLVNDLARFYTNRVTSVLCLGKGIDIPILLGEPETHFPYYLKGYNKGVRFCSAGNSFVQFDQEVDEDYRRFLPYWRSLLSQPGKVEAIPKVDREQHRWFLLYCEDNTNYGAIAPYFIEAYNKGYVVLFVIGVDLCWLEKCDK